MDYKQLERNCLDEVVNACGFEVYKVMSEALEERDRAVAENTRLKEASENMRLKMAAYRNELMNLRAENARLKAMCNAVFEAKKIYNGGAE